jgi:asparagine synthase (glutamine-hydrolysing)
MAKGKRRRNRVSAQFGRWSVDGLPLDQDYLAKAEQMLAPYGPDGGSAYIKDGVGILFRAFHTTKESRKETQPYVTPSGAVLTWDGRLDNREELVRELPDVATIGANDLAIAAAAYELWGTKCFAKLIGDWALSVWNPRNQSLVLAKDPVGTRHLYYSSDQKQITWSTILDPLVLLAGKTFTLEEEYIAGWLSFFPATHLTPYVGIHSVPPSCFVRLEPERQTVSKYWDFDPSKRIRYRTDGEYEEHFREIFAESVRRRLRSDSPVLAELSGGMDSSSIVCMADVIFAHGAAETSRLDTISYYNDSEPNWNERPYFTRVEEKRGRPGCHIEVDKQPLLLDVERDRFAASPSSVGGRRNKPTVQFGSCMAAQGNRVLLSGIGGDEVLGGVPTPIPELQDLLARARLVALVHSLKCWALNQRKPWFQLLFDVIRGFWPALFGFPKYRRAPDWLCLNFVKRNRTALRGYETRVKVFDLLPTVQGNIGTLDTLRRQLACSRVPFDPPYEKRLPYLDRELLEFLYAIPREQLFRPGQRRSLMRRALVGIVPNELLNRRRKAFVVRGPMANISASRSILLEFTRLMLATSIGIVDSAKFIEALQKAEHGQEVAVVYLMRTLGIELWLRNLWDWKVLGNVGCFYKRSSK